MDCSKAFLGQSRSEVRVLTRPLGSVQKKLFGQKKFVGKTKFGKFVSRLGKLSI